MQAAADSLEALPATQRADAEDAPGPARAPARAAPQRLAAPALSLPGHCLAITGPPPTIRRASFEARWPVAAPTTGRPPTTCMNLTPAQRQMLAWIAHGRPGFACCCGCWRRCSRLSWWRRCWPMRCIRWWSGWPLAGLPRLVAVLLVEVALSVAGAGRAGAAGGAGAGQGAAAAEGADCPALLDKPQRRAWRPGSRNGASRSASTSASLKAWLDQAAGRQHGGLAGRGCSARRASAAMHCCRCWAMLVLIPVALFYLLADWPQLVAACAGPDPAAACATRVNSFLAECDEIAGPVPARPAARDGRAGDLLRRAALAVVGLDLALPVGVFTGLAFAIPYLGFGLGPADGHHLGRGAAVRQCGWRDRGGWRSTWPASCSKASCSRHAWWASASASIRWR